MRRICLVVQRFGKQIVGGSEQLARCYARLLKEVYEVHVATTCAVDHVTWRNELSPGLSQEDGISVHRFPTDFERSPYFHRLDYSLLSRHILGVPSDAEGNPLPGLGGKWLLVWSEPSRKEALRNALRSAPCAIQEEFVRCQGPYSTGFLQFLEREKNNYDFFLFFTYLYPTTYFGAQQVPREKRILIPTLHDEPYAYLPIFREMAEDLHKVIFLTPGERTIAQQVWGLSVPAELVGMPVDISHERAATPCPEFPYVLFCGRIEAAKGSNTLFEYFLRYKKEHPSELKLVLIGQAVVGVPDHPDIVFLGYVDEAYKFSLMERATAFVHPSALESFSIVLLEAFLSGRPAIVNADSVVLAEHCRVANAGLEYRNYEEFAECLLLLIANRDLRNALGENGRRYVQENYSSEIITKKLRALLEHRDWECERQAANV
jgi:glycosyltransferase involved in cell wall biosynthesis